MSLIIVTSSFIWYDSGLIWLVIKVRNISHEVDVRMLPNNGRGPKKIKGEGSDEEGEFLMT
jgi:hypothetical protein